MSVSPGKSMDLSAAIAASVEPGMSLHFAMSGSRPNAAIRELYSRFRGTEPGFTLCSTGFGGPSLGLFLVDAGLAERLVAGFAGDQYPTPKPNKALGRRLQEGLVIEDWSLHTYLLRLRAAAMNVPYMPTASLAGSDLARERVERVTVAGERMVLVPALRPDLAFLHGVVGDEDGNVILPLPVGEGALGAAAARLGAIATVERIVSREEMREFAGLPALPGTFVRAICEAPFGAHPSGMYADRVDPALSYGDDYELIEETVAVLADAEGVPAEWADRWLAIGAGEYARRLEADGRGPRLRDWRGWQPTPPEDPDAPASRAERLCVLAAGAVRDLVEDRRPDTVLAGIGISSLATWLAADDAEGFPPLISEVGFIDYEPQPGNPFLFYFPNTARTSILTDSDMLLGLMLQGGGERCLAVLAAGEVDATGATNSSWTSRGWLTGSGGANDIASGAGDVVLVVPHSPMRLIESVAFVTSPGRNVRVVVTDRGVMRREDSGEDFTVIGVRPDGFDSLQEAVEDFVATVPWTLQVGEVAALAEPSPEQLRRIRAFDPRRHFLGTPESTAV